MRAVVQRVKKCRVSVSGKTTGEIAAGVCVLVGVADGDDESDAEYIAKKIVDLRIFEDAQGKMNLSLIDAGGSALLVSQFTLLGDVRKGKRPSFNKAMKPDEANRLFEVVVRLVANQVPVGTGTFGADMQLDICNDGPVTILMDSKKTF